MKTPRSRKEMIAFLSSHFRYSTMNSWNGQSSYAQNVKVSHLHFPDQATRNRAYDLVQVYGIDIEAGIRDAIENFQERHNHEYTIGFNGRSSGYMVLYDMTRTADDHKTHCYSCGQKNYKADTKVCGVCHSTNMHPYKGTVDHVSTKSIDGDNDFDCWDTHSLRNRVKLVMDFDAAVKEACDNFIGYCKDHKAEEVTVSVPHQVMRAMEMA